MYDNNYRGPSKKIAFKNASFKPRKKRPGFWKNIKDYFSDFSRHTTLNGFQYLGEQERSRIEKCVGDKVYVFCVEKQFSSSNTFTRNVVLEFGGSLSSRFRCASPSC